MNSSLIDHLIAIRRQIHRHPELGFRETETAKTVAAELTRIGIKFRHPVAETGIVAELNKGDGPCIMLRADMDALPIVEETGLPFASANPGVMHACGHDIHTTVLLGAANLLKEASFKGRIKFIFQPSEEGTYPSLFQDNSTKSGGQRMVEAGEMDDVDIALGLHVFPLLETGKIAFVEGEALAATGFFKITITGKAGHAGFPEFAIDPIMAASQLINNAQFIISRYTSPTQPKVISFTKIEGGVNENIIPGEVVILGTVRALNQATYMEVVQQLQSVIDAVALLSKTTITISYNLSYPSLFNDIHVHNKLEVPLQSIFGSGNIIKKDPIMGGEDFAFYSRQKPSMFYFLGAGDGVNIYNLHHPKVVFDEKCIPYGAEFLAKAAQALL